MHFCPRIEGPTATDAPQSPGAERQLGQLVPQMAAWRLFIACKPAQAQVDADA